MSPKISIVIPCYNEEGNVRQTLRAIAQLYRERSAEVEIIAVNDGSRDGTWKAISEVSQEIPNLVGINLIDNFGQSAAYQAGIDASRGRYVLFTSADLETDPKHLLTVEKHLDEGYDFVNTNRVNRWAKPSDDEREKKSLKNLKSQLANWLISKVSGATCKDRGSGTKGLVATVAKQIRFYTEMHRFIPDYVHMYTQRSLEFDVEFQDRQFGTSAYLGQNRSLKVLLDIITLGFMLNFAKKPFKSSPGRLLGISGFLLFALGGLGLAYLLALKMSGHSIGDRPLLVISVLFIIIGFQAVVLGIVGELLMRIYFESSGRKTYLVRETLSGERR
ncbi:MAG TPA: glycosyltransferase family 2 protein [Bdellovibrionota bacterium]|nr:glycosyltransferase family 2 protein [Bdellovibrionota bacterium]